MDGWMVGLDTLCFNFCVLFYSLMLTINYIVMPIMILKLIYYSQIMFLYTNNISISIILKHDKNKL